MLVLLWSHTHTHTHTYNIAHTHTHTHTIRGRVGNAYAWRGEWGWPTDPDRSGASCAASRRTGRATRPDGTAISAADRRRRPPFTLHTSPRIRLDKRPTPAATYAPPLPWPGVAFGDEAEDVRIRPSRSLGILVALMLIRFYRIQFPGSLDAVLQLRVPVCTILYSLLFYY